MFRSLFLELARRALFFLAIHQRASCVWTAILPVPPACARPFIGVRPMFTFAINSFRARKFGAAEINNALCPPLLVASTSESASESASE